MQLFLQGTPIRDVQAVRDREGFQFVSVRLHCMSSFSFQQQALLTLGPTETKVIALYYRLLQQLHNCVRSSSYNKYLVYISHGGSASLTEP